MDPPSTVAPHLAASMASSGQRIIDIKGPSNQARPIVRMNPPKREEPNWLKKMNKANANVICTSKGMKGEGTKE